MNNQTTFGGMLRHLVELTSILLRPEPLDQKIERHCKQMWEKAPIALTTQEHQEHDFRHAEFH